MLSNIFLSWLFGLVVLIIGGYLIMLPSVDSRIGELLNQHTGLFATQDERKKLYDWLLVLIIFIWFLVFFYILSQYWSNTLLLEYT
jgi:hypothetical protein